MTACPPYRKTWGPYVIARRDDTLGASGTSTVTARILGLSPQLQIGVQLYFRPNPSTGSVPASANTWQMAPAALMQGGELRDLAAIFTGRALPDGWELISAADALTITARLSIPSNEAGDWCLGVMAGPVGRIGADKLAELYGAIRIEAPALPTGLKYP